MPERICRGAPVPSSSWNFSSFSLFFTGSQARTLTTVISTCSNTSKAISGSGSGKGASSGTGAGLRRASRACSSCAASIRGKSAGPFCTAASRGSTPQVPRLSQSDEAPPRRLMISSAVSGIKGRSSPALMRMVSSRLYRTRASRGFRASSLARRQGSFSSIYLLARPMT